MLNCAEKKQSTEMTLNCNIKTESSLCPESERGACLQQSLVVSGYL